jgi:hypothetical protein
MEVSKLNYKSVNNSNPNNRTNVENELKSIIAGIKIPINEYIIHQLYKYMDISCIFKFNYYNLEYTSFEPMIEPLPMQYLSYQVDPIFRHKTLIKSDEIINFNISPACIKVLNLFLSRYYSDDKNDNILNIRESNMISKANIYKNDNNYNKNDKINKKENEEIIILSSDKESDNDNNFSKS